MTKITPSLRYEIISPYKRVRGRLVWHFRPKKTSLLKRFWTWYQNPSYNKLYRILGTLNNRPQIKAQVPSVSFKRTVIYFKSRLPRPKWEYVVIAFLLGLLLAPRSSHIVRFEPQGSAPAPKIMTFKPLKPLTEPQNAPQATLAAVYVPPPSPVVGNCGSDYYQQLVYQRESGCNTAAVNYLGCAGIGQACPGSKLPCTLYDWTCQNNYFTNYMLVVYGSWQAAWNSELTRGWW